MEWKHIILHETSNVTDESSVITKDKKEFRVSRKSSGWSDKNALKKKKVHLTEISKWKVCVKQAEIFTQPSQFIHEKKENKSKHEIEESDFSTTNINNAVTISSYS